MNGDGSRNAATTLTSGTVASVRSKSGRQTVFKFLFLNCSGFGQSLHVVGLDEANSRDTT